MFIKDGGKTIELRIRDAVLKDAIKRCIGNNPGVFPNKVVVKQIQEDGSEKHLTYLPESV